MGASARIRPCTASLLATLEEITLEINVYSCRSRLITASVIIRLCMWTNVSYIKFFSHFAALKLSASFSQIYWFPAYASSLLIHTLSWRFSASGPGFPGHAKGAFSMKLEHVCLTISYIHFRHRRSGNVSTSLSGCMKRLRLHFLTHDHLPSRMFRAPPITEQ